MLKLLWTWLLASSSSFTKLPASPTILATYWTIPKLDSDTVYSPFQIWFG